MYRPPDEDELKDAILYDQIYERKWIRKFSWQQISDVMQFGVNGKSMQKKFKRLATKLGLPYKPTLIEPITVNEPEPVIQKAEHISKDGEVLDEYEIEDLPYGSLPPTNYISHLDHDDWADEYLIFDEYFYMTEEEIEQFKKDWRQSYLTELRNRIWEESELMVLLPRGYGKTETVMGLFVRWFLETKLPLYIVCPSLTHCDDMLTRIESHCQQSVAIRRDYGDVCGKAKRGNSMMVLNYHPSIKWTAFDRPISLVTFKGGKKGKHPAWIHLEDVMQEEAVSIETNRRIKHRFNSTYRMMRRRNRSGERTKMTATGTRYALKDMYKYLIDSHNFNILHYKALISDTEMLPNPNYTIEDLHNIKDDDAPTFETEMQNNPIPSEGIYFSADHWKSVEEAPASHFVGVTYYMAMDPARGMSDEADNTAILVIMMYNGIAYIVDGFVGKLDDDEKEEKINEFYYMYNPAFTLIESTWAQIDMKRFAHLRGLVHYRDTAEKAKYMRIDAMKGYYKDGLIKAVNGIQPYDFLFNEYHAYDQTPSTASRKDDAIDCTSMIIQKFGQYLNKHKPKKKWTGKEKFHLTNRR